MKVVVRRKADSVSTEQVTKVVKFPIQTNEVRKLPTAKSDTMDRLNKFLDSKKGAVR